MKEPSTYSCFVWNLSLSDDDIGKNLSNFFSSILINFSDEWWRNSSSYGQSHHPPWSVAAPAEATSVGSFSGFSFGSLYWFAGFPAPGFPHFAQYWPSVCRCQFVLTGQMNSSRIVKSKVILFVTQTLFYWGNYYVPTMSHQQLNFKGPSHFFSMLTEQKMPHILSTSSTQLNISANFQHNLPISSYDRAGAAGAKWSGHGIGMPTQ